MAVTVSRLRHLLRPLLSSYRPHLPFSSLPNYSTCGTHSLLSNNPEEEQQTTGSLIYRKTLRTQRPAVIIRHKELENSVSLIGTVTYDVKSVARSDGRRCAYTQLKVESPPKSNKFVTIFLDMWEDMAELSMQHLKRNDYIYVSGYLRSSITACDSGNIILKQKVIVKEINFVANNDKQNNNIEGQEKSALEKQRKRLYLWQVFFANPYEWRDLRKFKVSPRQPDFKHKGTGEALWLNSDDPPWISKQLQLQDSRMVDMGLQKTSKFCSSLSTFDL